MIQKRAFWVFLMLALAVLPLAAGGGNQRTATASGADAARYAVTEPINIEYWHSTENQYWPTIEKVISNFHAAQSLIKVEHRYIGNMAALSESLVAAHAAGAGLPAVSIANTDLVASYGDGGLAEDLNPYIRATNFDIKDFGDGLIAASAFGNRQVSLPFLISTQVIYINNDLARSMGVQVPARWNDMEAFLRAGHRRSGGQTQLWAYILPGWDQWYFETYYLNNGVKIINPDGRTTDLDSPKAIEIAQKIKDWCDAGYMYWASGTNASNIMRQNFWEGRALAITHTSSLYTTHVANCNFEVGMVWLPGQNTKVSEIGGQVILIPAKADQRSKNAGWRFVEHCLSRDMNMIWATETGYMPTRKSVLNTDAGRQFVAEKPAFKVIFDNLDEIQPRIQHEAWTQLARIWMAYMAETINENKNVADQMRKMAVEINEALQGL
jgi:multiple sugar transport system substrate-binding protein